MNDYPADKASEENTPLPVDVWLAIEAGPNPDERFNDEWKRRELFAIRIARMAYEAGGLARSATPTTDHNAVFVPQSLAERTEAMFRSVDPTGSIAQEWKQVLAGSDSRGVPK